MAENTSRLQSRLKIAAYLLIVGLLGGSRNALLVQPAEFHAFHRPRRNSHLFGHYRLPHGHRWPHQPAKRDIGRNGRSVFSACTRIRC